MFPYEGKTSLSSQGFLLSVFKAPLPLDVVLHRRHYLKNCMGPERWSSGLRSAGDSKMGQWVLVLAAKPDEVSSFPGSQDPCDGRSELMPSGVI